MPAERNKVIFGTVAIVGVGLIGGSLGMSAKKNGLVDRVIGIGRSEEKLAHAKELGAIDDYSLDIENGAADSDLIVICTPVRLIVPTIKRMAASLKPGSVVTDVGSTKSEVVYGAEGVLRDEVSFVGGHPMAGSEQAGVDAAFPDLFRGATYVLTPTAKTDIVALGKMTELAEAVGAETEVMSPEQHDAAAAVISHLPHAMAAALLKLAEASQKKHGKVFQLAAGSFRDLTRISDSPPALWRDICTTNAEALIDTINGFQDKLNEFKAVLESGDQDKLVEFFNDACEIRRTYLRISK